jgi:hypothetical protein
MLFEQISDFEISEFGFAPKALGRRLSLLKFRISNFGIRIFIGYAVKTLESKETGAQRERQVTHNSVFAAHRLNAGQQPHVAVRHFRVPVQSLRKAGKMERSSGSQEKGLTDTHH